LATVRAVAVTVNGREVIVAIIGGTLLTLALTRPRLTWIEQLTEDSVEARLWAERALTCFLLVMAGYAAVTLLVALHKQLGPESDALLEVAGVFLFVYAWLVHFEPFVHEWRLRGGSSAAALYTAVIIAALLTGTLLTEVALSPSLSWVEPALAVGAALSVAAGCLIYMWGPDYHIPFDRLFEKAAPRRSKRSSKSDGDERPR
jgi:hypothetical protein